MKCHLCSLNRKMLAEVLETILWLQQYTLPAFLIILLVSWLYKEATMGVCTSKKRLDGKVAIVTGAQVTFS